MCRGRRSWGRPCWARSRTSVPLRLRWPPRGRRVRRRCSPPRSRREEGTGRARPGQLLIFGHILGHELLSCRSCGARSRSSGAGHEAGRRAFGRRRPDYGTDAIHRRIGLLAVRGCRLRRRAWPATPAPQPQVFCLHPVPGRRIRLPDHAPTQNAPRPHGTDPGARAATSSTRTTGRCPDPPPWQRPGGGAVQR
jgi:hypothetical protein